MDAASQTTGRAKTALVRNDGDADTAVISAVVARTRADQGDERIRFVGPGRFDPDTVERIREALLPIVDRILDVLDLPRHNFEISLMNVGAASSADIGIHVSGFSADVPVLLALLSAALQIPVPDDLASTGHIASSAGEITAVRAIPAKVAAAAADQTIQRFICPSYARNGSL